MIRTILAATVMCIGSVGTANALPILSGSFEVQAVNVTNLNRTESEATRENFDDAWTNVLGGSNSNSRRATFNYSGDIDFGTSLNSSTTIGDWLATGGPITSLNDQDLGPAPDDTPFLNLQQSKGSIDGPNGGTATTTFYLFTATLPALTDITVFHDDGFAIFEDGDEIGFFRGPTVEKETDVDDFAGGKFELLYVATNSDPSILKVQAVPLPAAAWLLLGVSGALVAAKRRGSRRAA